MIIKLNKSDWSQVGYKMGWLKTALNTEVLGVKKPKVLLIHSPQIWGITDNDLKILKTVCELNHITPKNMSQEKLAELCKDTDHLMLNIDCIESTSNKMERLDEKFYSNKNTQSLKSLNVDMSDLDYFNPVVAKKYCKKLIFQSVPNNYGNSAVANNVSESAICEILLHAKNRHMAYKDVENDKIIECRSGFILKQSVAGVIGYGTIGKLVTKKLEGLGMKVLVNDIKDIDRENVSLERIFNEAKVISVHISTVLPNGKSNVNFINSKLLNLCKGTILINLATDVIVNSHDVCDAINNKKIIGYSCEENYGSPKFAEKYYLPCLKKQNEFHLSPCSSGFGSDEVSLQMKSGWIQNTVSMIKGTPENIWAE